MDVEQLAQLGVLGKLWPPERVVLGTCVCRWMKTQLASQVEHVTVVCSSSGEPPDPVIVARSLERFSRNTVRLLLQPKCHSQVGILEGLEAAIASGFGRSLVHLDLQVGELCAYEYSTEARPGIGPWGMSRLATGLRACQQLEYLNLHGNKISAEGVTHLSKVFDKGDNTHNLEETHGGLPALTHLDLANNSLGSSGATHLAQWIGRCTKLQHLDLQLNKIGQDGAEALAPALTSCANLSCLHMRKNWITNAGARAILHETHGRLSCLFFSETKVSADVFSALPPGPLAISTLDLRDSMPCSPATFPALLARCPLLSVLDLEGCPLSAEPRAFGAAVATCRGLTKLRLPRCGLSPAWAEVLGPGALGECRAVQLLDMSDNDLGDGAATCIGQALRGWEELRSLSLARINVGAGHLDMMAAALGPCSQLRELDLSGWRAEGDEATKEAAVAVGRAVAARLPKLRVLTMARCGLGAGGVEELLGGLGEGAGVEEVVLWYNGVRAAEVERIRESALRANPRLTRVCLS